MQPPKSIAGYLAKSCLLGSNPAGSQRMPEDLSPGS
jgi:hypothetical protein